MKLSRAIPWALLLSTATLFSTIWSKEYTSCGGVLTDPMGRFFNYMGPKTVCTWTILMKPGQRVAVATPFLNLSCNEDYMEIQDGLPGSRSYGKICGGYGLSYCSSSNIMTIKYQRKSNYPASMFDVYFYGEPKVWEMEGVFTDFGQGHRPLRNEATSVGTTLTRPTQDVTLGSPLKSTNRSYRRRCVPAEQPSKIPLCNPPSQFPEGGGGGQAPVGEGCPWEDSGICFRDQLSSQDPGCHSALPGGPLCSPVITCCLCFCGGTGFVPLVILDDNNYPSRPVERCDHVTDMAKWHSYKCLSVKGFPLVESNPQNDLNGTVNISGAKYVGKCCVLQPIWTATV